MGLHNQLSDLSTDSLPIFLLSALATTLSHLRSLFLSFLHSFTASNPQSQSQTLNINDTVLFDAVGSGLAGLVLLSEQLNVNRLLSYKYGSDSVDSDCVVCLNRFADGEQVRKLNCRHVFHKECFDGWLDCLNFRCPLCRSPFLSDERVAMTRRRINDDVMNWFPFR